MKEGKSIQDLAVEIKRQSESKRDFVATTDKIGVVPTEKGVALQLPKKGSFPVNRIALGQIGDHTGIPAKYVSKCIDEGKPDLLANNIEAWFKKYPVPRLVRTLDNRDRAFLSDAFPTDLDNYDFFAAIYPLLEKRKLKIMSAEITERKLYVKAVDEQLFRDVPVGFKMGDGSHKIFTTVAPAVVLSNSEIGFGRLVVDTGVYESACTNLAMFAKGGMKRTHVGARHLLTEGFDAQEIEALMSNATRKKTYEALWLQVRDVIDSAFDEKTVSRRAEQYEAAAGRKITGKVDEVMEVVKEKFGLNEEEKDSIFKHLIEGSKLSQYGLSAAITRASQDVEDYDRATELEYLGGKVVELPRTEWTALAEAA